MSIPQMGVTHGSPPYRETAFKAALRQALAAGLGNIGAGLGAVPRGANFGTAFAAAAGGASKAYQSAQQAAQEYALKQAAMQSEQELRDAQKTHLEALAQQGAKPQPPVKKDITNMTDEEFQQYVKRVEAESRAKAAGKPVKPAAADQGGDVTLDEPTLRMAAHVYQQTGQLPPFGMGKAGAAARAKILTYAAHETPGVDVAANKASFGANQQALRSLVMTRESNRAFSETARANAQILKQTLNSIPDFGVRFGNRVGRWAASQAGSPQVAAFHTALGVLTPELGRILQQGNITGGQPLTDAAKKDMKAVLSGDFTKAQFNAALDVLFRDMTNKDKSYGDQINAVKGQLKFGGAPADSTMGDPLGIR